MKAAEPQLERLVEHNISDARRNEIAENYKLAQKEQKTDKLRSSSSIHEIKKMILRNANCKTKR